MTPEETAEGRRLLEAYDAGGLQRGAGERGWAALRNDLRMWLWANREELVRCAELQSVPTPFDPTRCAAHTWFHPEPGQLCCFCVDAAKSAPQRTESET